MKRDELRILLDKWYDALYNGEFKQGKGVYCRKDEDGNLSYCCLGVLAHVAGIDPEKWETHNYSSNIGPSHVGMYKNDSTIAGHALSPQAAVLNLRTTLGSPGLKAIGLLSLATMNDDQNMTFKQIADHVKEHEEDYFIFED